MTPTDPFADIAAAAQARVGARLFTVLACDERAGALRRVYSSHPVEYPLDDWKVFPRDAPWIRQVVIGQQPYFGPDATSVAAVFDDHELIASLGCGAVVNVPVVSDGRTLGVLNLLDAEGSYTPESVEAAIPLAQLAIEPLRHTATTHEEATE